MLFTGAAYAETEIDLSGQWSYRILSSGKEHPPTTEGAWSSVELPGRNLFTLIARKHNITRGFLLYRKTFTISEVPREPLAFQAGEIMNADTVYINGKTIGKTGIFPPAFKSGWSKFRHYPVPRELLARGENTIDILCYFDAELWFLSPIRIIDERRGSREFMIRNFFQIEFIHAFCILLAGLSLLYFSIYLKRKKETMYLYYAGATFFLADMTILQFVENLYTFLPLSSNTIYKICGIGPMFFPPFLAFFFRSYLGLEVTRRRLAAYLFLPFLFAILMVASQDRYHIIHWRNVFLLLIPLYIADIVIISIRQLIAGNKKGLLLFIALIPIFVFGVYDILVFSLHAFEGSVPLYPIGVPFMVALIGLHLVNRFIFNLNASERLNSLLQEKMEEGKRLASLENELSIARKIQLATVPKSLPESTAFSIGVKYIPAENISGDFYNFHSIEQDRLGVLVADVSGHGVPASLIASMVKILFSMLMPIYSQPVEFITRMNAYLFDKMEDNFLTAGYCYIDKPGKKAFFARAGHEPLIHISRGDGETILKEYSPRGIAIGLKPRFNLDLAEFEIEQGDRIILYTDGLTEILRDDRKVFGHVRLKGLFQQSARLPVKEATEFIYQSLKEWGSPGEFQDDFTLIIIDID